METLKILYRSFYDTSLSSTFIVRGKDVGFKILFLLALIGALVTAGQVGTVVSSFSGTFVRNLLKDIPAVTIRDGKIQEEIRIFKKFNEKNEAYSYSSDNENSEMHLNIKRSGGSFFFDVDTTVDTPPLDYMSEDGIFVSKMAIWLAGQNKIQSIKFSDIIEDDELVIDQSTWDKMFSTFKNKVLKYIVIFTALLLFAVFSILLTLLWLVLSFVVSVFALVMRKQLTFEQKMRTAILALTPAVILKNAAGYAELVLPLPISFLIVLAYIYIYLKSADTDADDRTDMQGAV